MQKAKSVTARRAAVCVALSAVLWAALALVFLKLSPLVIIKFFLFTALAVIVPGIAAYKALRLRLAPLAAFALCYSLGLLAVVAVYFVCALLKIMSLIPVLLAAVCVISLVILYKSRSQPLCAEADDGEFALGLAFALFALLATFFTLSAAMLDPSLTGERAYFHDTMYGVSMCTSAANGLPLSLLQMSGVEMKYHMFYFAYCAAMKLSCGLDSFTVVTKLSLVTLSPLLAASTAALARSLLKKNGLAAAACFVTLVIPCAANVHYFYQDVIGYSLGLACAALCVLLFFKGRELGGGFNRLHAAAVVMLVGSLGAKGPLAAPVVFGICLILLFDFIERKDKGALVRACIYGASFVVFYALLYFGSGSGNMGIHPTWDSGAAVTAVQSLSWLPQPLFRLAVCVRYALAFYPPISVMFGFTAISLFVFRKREDMRPLNRFCFYTTLLGFVLINFIHQTGESERYFILVMLPFLAINTARAVYELVKHCGSRRLRLLAGCACAASLLPFAVTSAKEALFCYWNGGQVYYTAGLYDAIYHSRFEPDGPVNPDYRRKATTPAEYEAMLWLRDNTPADSVIADGRYLPNNKYFSGSAFSERAFFLEGWGYITDEDTNAYTDEKVRRDTFLRHFFESGDEGYIPLLAREGCDYLIICEYINPGLTLTDEYCERVFENDEVQIYKLREYHLD